MKLSERRARFVKEYLIDLNATRAAEAAGYSPKTATMQASRLLTFANVQAAVIAGQKAKERQSGINQARVLAEVELLSFSDVTHYAVDDNGDVTLTDVAPVGAMRALSSIKRKITTRGSGETREVTREVELKLWDKPGPLKLAGQHVGLFSELGDKARPVHGVTKVTFGGRYKPEPKS